MPYSFSKKFELLSIKYYPGAKLYNNVTATSQCLTNDSKQLLMQE